MEYKYELIPLNSRKQMYDCYHLDNGTKIKRCMIMTTELRKLLKSPLDIRRLDVGQLSVVRLSERILLNAAKQIYL